MKYDWVLVWWCKKYNRPRKDPLLLTYSPEELYIEWLEEQIEENPEEAFPRPIAGQHVVRITRDPVFNRIEAEAAAGEEEIDVLEELPYETRMQILKFAKSGKAPSQQQEVLKPHKSAEPELLLEDEFNDTYGDDK